MKNSKSFERFFSEKVAAAKAEVTPVFKGIPDLNERKRWVGCMHTTMMAYVQGARESKAIDDKAAAWYSLKVYELTEYLEELI